MKRLILNAFLVGVTVFLGYGLVTMHEKRVGLEDEFAILREKAQALEGENAGLQEDINFFSFEENVEKEARARLNLKEPGEQLIIVSRSRQPDEAATDLADEERAASASVWDAFRALFD